MVIAARQDTAPVVPCTAYSDAERHVELNSVLEEGRNMRSSAV